MNTLIPVIMAADGIPGYDRHQISMRRLITHVFTGRKQDLLLLAGVRVNGFFRLIRGSLLAGCRQLEVVAYALKV